MDCYQTLKDLMLLPAMSGHEQRVAWYMRDYFIKLGFNPDIDVFGNVLCEVKGKNPNLPVLMIFSHMDSIGLVVKKIDDQGFIRIERLGGVPEKVLPGLAVQIETKDAQMIDGYVCVKQKHITPPEELNKVEPFKELFIDIGATCKKEVEDLGIEIGNMVVYKPTCTKLLNNRVFGTSPDNRRGCTVVLGIAEELAKHQPEQTVWLVGSVQEEFSLQGAQMAAKHIHPKMAIGIDGGIAADGPKLSEIADTKLGGGPIMYKYNFHGRGTLNGTLAHPKMVKWMEEAASRCNVNIQKLAMVGALTDLSYVQYVDEGVGSVDMGIGGRNGHSPVESLCIDDMYDLIKLVCEFINGVKEPLDLRRW